MQRGLDSRIERKQGGIGYDYNARWLTRVCFVKNTLNLVADTLVQNGDKTCVNVDAVTRNIRSTHSTRITIPIRTSQHTPIL